VPVAGPIGGGPGRAAPIYLPSHSHATPTRGNLYAGVPGQVPGFSIDQGNVTFVGARTFPHYIVYPQGGFYPVYYSSYPWAAQAYDVPGLEGLALDYGFLELHLSPPDAAVVVDGMELGGAPESGALVPVRSGYHSIQVYREGYRPLLLSLTVGAGRAHPVRAALEPLPAGVPERMPAPHEEPLVPAEKGSGTLKLRVPHAGARVLIDGEPWGEARADAPGFLVLPAGDHTIQVDTPGQRSFLTNVRIQHGATTALDVTSSGE